MKKILLVLLVFLTIFMISGCGKKKEEQKPLDYLMSEYVRSYTEGDLEAVKNIFPPYYMEFAKHFMTEEYLKDILNGNKELFGDNFTVTYEITKETKLNDKKLDALNKSVAEEFDTNAKASICYKIEGTTTFKGSIKEEVGDIENMNYCKYGDNWYFVKY